MSNLFINPYLNKSSAHSIDPNLPQNTVIQFSLTGLICWIYFFTAKNESFVKRVIIVALHNPRQLTKINEFNNYVPNIKATKIGLAVKCLGGKHEVIGSNLSTNVVYKKIYHRGN